MPSKRPFGNQIFPFGHNAAERDHDMLDRAFIHVPHVDAALDPEVVLIIGRRASGKTALCYHIEHLEEGPCDIVIDVEKDTTIAKVLEDMDKGLKRVGEVATDRVADLWEFTIWTALMQRLLLHETFKRSTFAGALRDTLTSLGIADETKVMRTVRALFRGANIFGSRAGHLAEMLLNISDIMASGDFKKGKQQVINFLEDGHGILIAIDTMEDYRVRDPLVDQALAGLLTAVSRFAGNKPHKNLHLKCFFPAEVLPYVENTESINLRKVAERPLYLHWTSKDLQQMLCRRLTSWLADHIPTGYARLVDDIDWESPTAIRERAWNLVFPEMVTNGLGQNEDSYLYIARHTQLHPGQVIWVANEIAQAAYERGYFPSTIEESDIVDTVARMERRLAKAILETYSRIYPQIARIVLAAFGRSDHFLFRGSDLTSLARKTGQYWDKAMPFDEQVFIRMCLDAGVIGRVERTTAHYNCALFEYHSHEQILIEPDDLCAVHPLFYGSLEMRPRRNRNCLPVCPSILLSKEVNPWSWVVADE